jgi:hypothetical protein
LQIGLEGEDDNVMRHALATEQEDRNRTKLPISASTRLVSNVNKSTGRMKHASKHKYASTHTHIIVKDYNKS